MALDPPDGAVESSEPPVDDATDGAGPRAGGRRSPALTRLLAWFRSRRPALQALFAFLGFLIVSTLTWGTRTVPHMTTTFVGGGLGDAKLYIWDLAWWPHALIHAQNPFLNPTVWAPQGVNMAWVTGLPGPALVMAPVTLTLGPVVSSNILALLAPSLAAWAAFLMCRRVTHRFWPSIAGGYLFGASTYMVGQMRGHLNLILIFPIPLAVYLLLRRLDGSLGRWRFCALFTLSAVGLFSISTEVFATATLFGGIALAGALLLGGRDLRERLLPATGLVALTYAATALVVSPLVYYTFHGAPPPLSRNIAHASADLLGYLLPRRYTVIGGSTFASTTNHFTANMSEDGSYLGVPLLVVMILFAWERRKHRSAWLLLAFGVFAAILALGTVLHVGGKTYFALPWALLDKVPLIGRALPQRFTLYVWMSVAVVVALWLSGRRAKKADVARWGTVAVAALFLFPSVWSIPNLNGAVDQAVVFQNGNYERFVERNAIAVIITPAVDQNEMLWQAQTGFWFRLAVGYTGPPSAQVAKDPIAMQLLSGHHKTISTIDFARWIYSHDVSTVFISNGLTKAWDPMVSAISLPPVQIGKFTVYPIAPATPPPPPPSGGSTGATIFGTFGNRGLIQSFDIPDAAGGPNLRFRAGSPAVIGLWSTWCKPCAAQLADWQRASRTVPQAFYGIAEASDPSAVRAQLAQAGVGFPVGLDPQGVIVLNSYPQVPMPVTLFVDARGIVVHEQPGMLTSAQIVAMAKRFLARPSTASGGA